MRRPKIRSSYTKLSDDELAVLGGKIVGAMAGNNNFPDPQPELSVLQEAAEDFRQKHEVSVRGGSLLEKRIKNQSRRELLTLLSELAFYVNKTGRGDAAVLTSAGMILEKPATAKEVPYVIDRVILKDGSLSGQMWVHFTAQRNIWDYEIEVGTWPEQEPDIVWQESHFTTSSRSNVIASLKPGMRYYVRVRARNAKGIGDWTPSYAFIVR